MKIVSDVKRCVLSRNSVTAAISDCVRRQALDGKKRKYQKEEGKQTNKNDRGIEIFNPLHFTAVETHFSGPEHILLLTERD